MVLDFISGRIVLSEEKREISLVIYKDIEISSKPSELFSLRLKDNAGAIKDYTSADASEIEISKDKKTIRFFSFPENIEVNLDFITLSDGVKVRTRVINGTKKTIEHMEVLPLKLKPLVKNGGIGELVCPYNEGLLINDNNLRISACQKHTEPGYPSYGSNWIFPNMLSSQFILYMFKGHGLYIGAEDEMRAPKEFDYYDTDDGESIKTEIRLYSGKNEGEDFFPSYDMVFRFFDGDWHDGADIYRDWFYSHLPKGVRKVKDNDNLPDWYKECPVILTYPVRGYHDMDTMTPNELYPYINAIKYVDKFQKATGAKIMVILMHWEGTAPWAPPYVYPPFGGEGEFDKFLYALKERGDFLGVYCSGFSFTEVSNVIPTYNNLEMLKDEETFKAFCAGRDNKVLKSNICTGQRSGYDICPASSKGREILDSAYKPLFNKHIDYIQILDQNHGGGQYFCYSKDHGHPSCVGEWMTTNMRGMLSDWNKMAGRTLLGCESAASEPFIGNLLFSDNRYEINHVIGKSIPLYSYLYHEFLHNFMGNQVSSIMDASGYLYRLAYSFVAGDMPTVILHPKGTILARWGQRDMSDIVNEDDLLVFIKNLHDFYITNSDFMNYGKMIKPIDYQCEETEFKCRFERTYTDSAVLSSAITYEGKNIQMFVNYNTEDKKITIEGKEMIIKSLSVVKIDL